MLMAPKDSISVSCRPISGNSLRKKWTNPGEELLLSDSEVRLDRLTGVIFADIVYPVLAALNDKIACFPRRGICVGPSALDLSTGK